MFDNHRPPLVPSEPVEPPPQVPSPRPTDRYRQLQYLLARANRLEDFPNIIELLSPPRDVTTILPPGTLRGKKVAVLGAGVAGLAAAFELRKLGCDITIYEARSRVGGRIYTYYFDSERQFYGELGAMRIPVSHETVWYYVDLFRLRTVPFVQANERGFLYVRNVRVRNKADLVSEKIYPCFRLTAREQRTPWPELLDYALGTPLKAMPPAVRRQTLQIRRRYSRLYSRWTLLNIRQVMLRAGFSPAAIDLLGRLSPFTGAFFYNSYSEVLHDDYSLDFAFLYQIVGGMARLPEAFYSSLKSRQPCEYENVPLDMLGEVAFRLRTPVTGLFYDTDNSQVVVESRSRAETDRCHYDYVICTFPFATLRTVNIYPQFTNAKMEAIREVNYANALKSVFLCSRSFWEDLGILGGASYTDLPILSIWYPSYRQPLRPNPDEPGVLLASYSFNLDAARIGGLQPSQRFDEIKQEVEEVHGLPRGYLNDIVVDHATVEWNDEPWSRGALCYFFPGQKLTFAYHMEQPEYNGRVLFAGEHISPKHAWIQGALSSALRAVNKLALIHRKRARR